MEGNNLTQSPKEGQEALAYQYFGKIGEQVGLSAEECMYIKNIFSSLKLTRKEAVKYIAAKIAHPASRRSQPKEFLLNILNFLVEASTLDIIRIIRNSKLDLTLEDNVIKVLKAICADEGRDQHITGYANSIIKLLRSEQLELTNE